MRKSPLPSQGLSQGRHLLIKADQHAGLRSRISEATNRALKLPTLKARCGTPFGKPMSPYPSHHLVRNVAVPARKQATGLRFLIQDLCGLTFSVPYREVHQPISVEIAYLQGGSRTPNESREQGLPLQDLIRCRFHMLKRVPHGRGRSKNRVGGDFFRRLLSGGSRARIRLHHFIATPCSNGIDPGMLSRWPGHVQSKAAVIRGLAKVLAKESEDSSDPQPRSPWIDLGK